ncbi:MAG: Ig domain-containing protein [Myxococcota bacterium]
MRITAGPLRSLGLFTLCAAAAACSDDDDLRISPSSVPNATIGQLYQVQFDLEGDVGGTPTWSVLGALPTGLGQLVGPEGTVQPDGTVRNRSVGISGTPEEPGVFTFVLEARGSDDVVRGSYTLRVIAPLDPLRITTGSPLPGGRIGTPYEAAIGARGGTETSYGWRILNDSLPAGLEIAPSGTLSTRISGTPSVSGEFSVGIEVQDSGANVATATLALVIQDGTLPLEITTTRLAGGSRGTPYDETVTAIGGTGEAYTWSFNGLPAGLRLESGTPSAHIVGTPTEVVATGVEFRVQDSEGNVATRALTLSISPPEPLIVLTSSTAPGRVGEVYESGLRAFGGVPPYTWDAPQGLPQGLAITGPAITGTPLVSEETQIVVEVEDSLGTTSQREIGLAIESALLEITTSSLPDGATALPYAATLQATGGVEPFTWSIDAGALPDGLMLSDSGLIAGTPRQFGLFPVRYRVTDDDGEFVTRELILTIDPPVTPLAVTTSTLPAAMTDEGYLAQIVASGGTTFGYTWTISGGSLPDGLQIQNQGTPSTLLLGFPTQTGTFNFTVTVTDSGAQTASRAFSLTVISGGG